MPRSCHRLSQHWPATPHSPSSHKKRSKWQGSKEGGREWQTHTACITTEYASPHASLHLSPRLPHLRPMETHTHIFTKTQKIGCKLLHKLTIKARKKIKPWYLKFQLIRRRSRWQTRLQLTKLLPISGTFPKKHIVLTNMPTRRAPYACHIHTLLRSDAHTRWPLQENSQTQTYWLAGLFEGYHAL